MRSRRVNCSAMPEDGLAKSGGRCCVSVESLLELQHFGGRQLQDAVFEQHLAGVRHRCSEYERRDVLALQSSGVSDLLERVGGDAHVDACLRGSHKGTRFEQVRR